MLEEKENKNFIFICDKLEICFILVFKIIFFVLLINGEEKRLSINNILVIINKENYKNVDVDIERSKFDFCKGEI